MCVPASALPRQATTQSQAAAAPAPHRTAPRPPLQTTPPKRTTWSSVTTSLTDFVHKTEAERNSAHTKLRRVERRRRSGGVPIDWAVTQLKMRTDFHRNTSYKSSDLTRQAMCKSRSTATDADARSESARVVAATPSEKSAANQSLIFTVRPSEHRSLDRKKIGHTIN